MGESPAEFVCVCVCVLGSFENNDQDPEHFGGASRARVSLY